MTYIAKRSKRRVLHPGGFAGSGELEHPSWRYAVQLLQLSAWKPTYRPASTLAADRDDVAPEARGYSDGDVGDGRSDLDHDVPRRTPPRLQNPLGALGGVARCIVHQAPPVLTLNAATAARNRRVDHGKEHT